MSNPKAAYSPLDAKVLSMEPMVPTFLQYLPTRELITEAC